MCSVFESLGYIAKASMEYNESSIVVTGFVIETSSKINI